MSKSKNKDLKNLEKLLDYEFNSKNLLEKALTHRSYSSNNNERLEFIGDSALNLAITINLFNRNRGNDKLSEGEMSRFRSSLVCQEMLFEIAKKLTLNNFILLGKGEIKCGGGSRPSIMADTFEALIGGILLDSDFIQVCRVVDSLFSPILTNDYFKISKKDPKSELQEILQNKKLCLPQYTVLSKIGAEHKQEFKVECLVSKLNIKSYGNGNSIKAAETEAAIKALEIVRQKIP